MHQQAGVAAKNWSMCQLLVHEESSCSRHRAAHLWFSFQLAVSPPCLSAQLSPQSLQAQRLKAHILTKIKSGKSVQISCRPSLAHLNTSVSLIVL